MRSFLPLLVLTGCVGESLITKQNNEPVATITSHSDGDTVETGLTVTFRGQISDLNDGTEELVATWFSGAEVLCAEAPVAADGATLCEAVLGDGDARIVLEGRDPDDAIGSDTVELSLVTSGTPEAEITAPLPDADRGARLYSDQDIAVGALVSDAEDAAADLEVAWTDESGAAVALGGPGADGAISGAIRLPEGAHSLTLTVTDSTGKVGVDSVEFTVGGPNQPPRCEITAPLDGASATGGDVRLEGLAGDPDLDPELLVAEWSSDLQGALGNSAVGADGATGLDAALDTGTHRLQMSVSDEVGATCVAEILFTVGTPPTAEIALPAPGTMANEGEIVPFSGTVGSSVYGPETLDVRWESDLDGALDTAAADGAGLTVFDSAALTPGLHTITLRATDADGLYAEAQTDVWINGLPSAPGVEIQPGLPATGDDLIAVIAVAPVDPENDPISYRYAWTRDGAPTGWTADTVPATETARGEVWAVSATPEDGMGAGPAGTASVTIGNTAPSLADAALTPLAPVEGDTLTCAPGSSSDADGDAVGADIGWEVNGLSIPATGSALGDAWWGRGDQVACVVTPTDGIDSGAPVWSNTVTVGNRAPSATGAQITPDPAVATDTLTCAVAGFSDADADADQSLYAWTVDGAPAGVGDTLAGGFAGGDTVTCEIIPFDGQDYGATVSTSLTIENSPPVLASVSLTPAAPAEADTLTCAPGPTADADGTASFSYTYAWTVGGAIIPATGSTLTGADFSRGDQVRCTVTPSDGTDSGAAVASALVTIQNSAPVMSSVSLTPPATGGSGTLTCAPAGTDLDGDTLSYSYAWYVNGAAIAPTTETLTGTWFDVGDSVYCSAAASDGAATSAPMSSNVATVQNTAPVMTGVALTPAAADEASTLTCAPAATDADGDAVTFTYAWYVNSSLIAPTTPTLTGTYFSRGNTVYCRATPTDGTNTGAAMSSGTVTISNTAPTMTGVALTPATAYEASTLTCTPTGADADGDSLSYAYTWTVNSAVIAPTTPTLTGAYFSKGSTVSCAATASDGSATSAALASSSVTVANSAPTMSSVSLNPATAYEGSTLTCTPAGADADGDTLSYTYTWSVNGSLIAQTTSTLTGTYFSRGNTVSCAATANDGSATSTALASSSVTISNTAPVASAATLTPATAYESTTLTCAGAGSDADGDAVAFTYAWYVNSSLIAPTTSTLTGTYFSKGNSVYCRATPTDGTDAGTAVSSGSVTIANSAPTMSSVTLTPATAYEASTLTCTPSGADADGDSLSYAYTWSVNGAVIAPTASTLTGAYFSRGNTVSCSVTTNDGFTTSAALASSSVTVQNTAPVTSSVSLSPTTAYEGSTLTCTPTTTDADGDAVSQTYAWYVNSSLIAPTTSTLTGTYFSRGNTVYCRATPTDGSNAGSAVSSSTVTVSNSAPTAPTVNIDPAAPEVGDSLWCDITAASTDADGDALTYTFAWTRNGSAYTGATTTTRTGDTIPAAATTAGHVWVCSATASDGSASSAAGTDSATVLAASYTIGYYNEFTTPGSGSAGANYSLAQQIIVPSTVQLHQLGIRMRLADTDLGRAALYTDSGGSPGSLVAYTNLAALTAGPVDMDVVGGPVTVSAGTYWITMNFSGIVYHGYTTVGASANTIKYNSLSSGSAFPSSFGSPLSFTGQFINVYMIVR